MAPNNCTKCGVPLPPKTGRGRPRKVCLTCRPARLTAARPAVTPLETSTALHGRGLIAAVVNDLRAADAEACSAGQAALLLARRIESDADSGASMAQLVKQLLATVATAVGTGNAAVGDVLDELKARREHRGA